MSIKVMASVWEHSRQEGTALLMLLAIADNANEYGEAWPGIKSLAEKCRMKERQAQRLIHKLEDAGELKIAIQQGADTPTGRTNMYTVITPGAVSRIGVSSSTPVGVSSRASRGVIQGTQGVSSSTPKPSVKPSGSGGARAREDEDAAAAVSPVVIAALKQCGLTDAKAREAALLQEFTPCLIKRLKAWREIKQADVNSGSSRLRSVGGLLTSILVRGDLPDDLPPPDQPVLSDEDRMRQYLANFDTTANHADYRGR